MAGFLSTILAIGYFGLGLIQWWATIDGLEYWFDISGFIAFILSGFIAYIPLIGTIAGFKGAMDVWGWDFIQAALLFFGPFIAIVIISVIGGVLDKVSGNRNE